MYLLYILFILFVILFVMYQIVKGINNMRGRMNLHPKGSEQCPACERRVKLAQTDPVCPACGTRLARNDQGDLMIRIN